MIRSVGVTASMLKLVMLDGSLCFFDCYPTFFGDLVCFVEFNPRRSFNARTESLNAFTAV
jgi:hypothetical protein